MRVDVNYETDTTCDTLQTEQTYFNTWDGELFSVVGISGETVTVFVHHSSTVELVDKDMLTVDFERIIPVKGELDLTPE